MKKIFIILLLIASIVSIKIFAADRYTDLQTFTKVLNLIQQYYVEEVDSRKLLYGAIKGMLRELDPHTNFMPADIYKEFESETSGEFGGLGIEISVQSGILTIISPIEDAPAWEAGIKSGDKIVGINGTSTKGLSLVEAAQLMRGKKGSSITLSIVRNNSDTPKDFIIKRGNVKIKSVKYTDFEDGYAYIRITSFIENTFKDIEKVLTQHEKKYSNFKGMIIDLRRNPGGLFDQATKISDYFLDSGTIVSTIGRNKAEKETVVAKKDGGYPNVPLVVLINEYSASASEILAGALQDNQRALIIGERSFGKGSVQSVVKLGDGSGLKLTVARYYTPSGSSIQAEGITPDVFVENIDLEALVKSTVKADAVREKDIEGHLNNENTKNPPNSAPIRENLSDWWNDTNKKAEDQLNPRDKILKTDYQVYQAFNYLKTWKLMKNFSQIK
jgi:carboxyl-terminal processing protease